MTELERVVLETLYKLVRRTLPFDFEAQEAIRALFAEQDKSAVNASGQWASGKTGAEGEAYDHRQQPVYTAAQYEALEAERDTLQAELEKAAQRESRLVASELYAQSELQSTKQELSELLRLVGDLKKSQDRVVWAGAERTGVGRKELGLLNAYAGSIQGGEQDG